MASLEQSGEPGPPEGETAMHLRKLCKDSGSGDGGCPAAYLTDETPADYKGESEGGGVVIQGIRLALDDIDQLDDFEPYEVAGWVPANVILNAADLIRCERGEAA